MTIVTPAMAAGLHSDVLRVLAARLLAVVSIVVAALVVRMSIAVLYGRICVAERVRSIQPRAKASAP